MTVKTFVDFGIELKHNSGEEDTRCPRCSDSRRNKSARCLSVSHDKGVWFCHHCGWSGGLAEGEQTRPVVKKTWRRPVYRPVAAEPPERELAWFGKRGITPEVLRRNRVTSGPVYMPQVEEQRNAVWFPYYRGDEVVNVKYRTGDKMFRMEGGAERVLYGLDDIGETLVWVEGEIDKLSVEVAGITSCVSVPDGAPTPNTKNYESKFDFLDAPELERAKVHIIAVDDDEPGHRLEEELTRRLGRENCRVARWPEGCKDANDVLVKHGAETLRHCIDNARELPVEGEHAVREFADPLRNLYRFGMKRGQATGWLTVDKYYTVLPGEWTVVTGIPGHGKSEWLDALMVQLAMSEDWRFAVFSPENQPTEEHIRKLAEKYLDKPFWGEDRMSAEELDRAAAFLDEHFTFLLPENPTVEGLITSLKAIVKRRGIKGVVLDPWNEIDHSRPVGMSETEYISRCLSKLRAFARAAGVHLWLVAHPTKLEKDQKTGNYPVPTPYDIAGSAHWRNKADNCITVWRDLKAHDDLVEIHVQKIRKKAVGRVGMVKLKYQYSTGNYQEFKAELFKDAA